MLLAYIRVSTDGQADGTSPEEQRRKILGLAAMQDVAKFDLTFYEDLGVSGATPLAFRPAGARLLTDVKPGDVIVACKLDRLFRSAIDALETVKKLKEKGIDVILIDLGTEPVSSSATGRLFFGLLAQFAEFERERIAERTIEGRAAKAARLGHIGGCAPYGFRAVGSGKAAVLVENENEQEILKVVREMTPRFTNWTIARTLARKGFLNRAGRPFGATEVGRLMKRVA